MKKILGLLILALACAGCRIVDFDHAGGLVPPTAERDPRLPQIRLTVAGHERAIHLETFGQPDRPALFILHGSLGDYRPFLSYQQLADRYFVVLWDQRGNGLSERVTEAEIGSEFVIEEIDRLRERFSPGRPITLMGHSFGAMYTALYLSARPQHVQQAILLEPAGLNSAGMQVAMDRSFQLDLLGPTFAARSWQHTILAPADHDQLDYKALSILKGANMQYFCDPANPPDWPVWRSGAYYDLIRNRKLMQGTKFSFDFAYGLQNFEPEVLLVGGACGGIGYDFQREFNAPLFRRCRVERIENAGHRLVTEQFEAVIALLKTYLSEYQ